MAITVIALAPEGLTLTLELYPVGSDTMANGVAADEFTESANDRGTYTATVAEDLSGHHVARLISGGVTIGKAIADFSGAGSTRTLDLVTGDKDGYSLAIGQSTSIAQAVWESLTAAYAATTGSFGKLLGDYITGNAFTRLGAPIGDSHAADIAAVKDETVAIKAKTDNLPSNIDGLTMSLAFKVVLAVLLGRSDVVSNQVMFKDRSGETICTITYGSTRGQRTESEIEGEE